MILDIINKKIRPKVKQYGIVYVIKQAILFIILSGEKTNITIDNKYTLINISRLEELNELLVNNKVNWDIKINVLEAMLKRKENLFLIISNKTVCAYAASQEKGEYKFGFNTKLSLPTNIIMFKNLYVSIDFRGCSLGKYLNVTRINNILDNQIAIVLVQTENKIAIKNWKKLGLEKIADITQITLFKKYTKNKINFIDNADKYTNIRKAFNELS